MPARPVRVLVVDDDAAFRDTLKERFEKRGFEVTAAPNAEVALALLAGRPQDIALVDVCMPGMDGLTLLRHARDAWPLLEVILITARGSIESAIEAIKTGAYTYLTKPVRMGDLDVSIQRALEHATLTRDRHVQGQALARRRDSTDFVYRSREMKALVETAERAAASDATLLIEGETGTGKEILAQYIHRKSPRAEAPFVVVDCGALADTILERELFGHDRGAYTGADEARPGLVTIAEGGTLLIDEIAHTSVELQARLLRLVERGRYRRLGDPRELVADVRILAATNQDLQALVQSGRFREDLYHRLNVLRLRVPPLRERREDILPLAAYFLARHSPVKDRLRRLTAQAESALLACEWPGNVRELGNVIQRACLVTPSEELEALDLGFAEQTGDGPLSLAAAEKRHVESVLASVGGDKARAADLLGITQRHLYRKLRSYGLAH